MTSSLRFSSYRRRFSRPLLIVYSRQKPVHDEEAEEGMLQNAGSMEDVQTTWEETVRKVAENHRRKNRNSGQVDKHSDRKKNRNRRNRKRSDSKTVTTMQHTIGESTELEVASPHQQLPRQSQNSSMAGSMNRLREEQNYRWQKQDNESTTPAVRSPSIKYTAQNRMTVSDSANALRRRRRTKRGVLNNEVDVLDDDIRQSDRGPTAAAGYDEPRRTRPGLLRGRANRHTLAATAGSIYINYDDTEQLPDSVFNIGDRKKEDATGKRRNNRVRGRRRKQSSLMTLLRNPDDHFNDRHRSTAADDTCKKKRLRVNFADIGWGEWIIAPEFFDAFYCDGFCSFPMSRVSQLQLTNCTLHQ